jgi:hypothetical protein
MAKVPVAEHNDMVKGNPGGLKPMSLSAYPFCGPMSVSQNNTCDQRANEKFIHVASRHV